MDIPVESFSGHELCRVSKDMSDQDIKTKIQSKLGITSCIELFRHEDVVMYGIMDDRPTLLGMSFAEQLGWDLEKPCQEWDRCSFNGTTLTKIKLYRLNLTVFPSGLDKLSNLQGLWCGGNQIREVPSELGNLTNLQELHYNNNQLTELPSELGNMANLNNLDCSENQLTELPTELGNLTNLLYFACTENQLHELPTELGNLTNLQQLYCSENQLGDIPPEILMMECRGCWIEQ